MGVSPKNASAATRHPRGSLNLRRKRSVSARAYANSSVCISVNRNAPRLSLPKIRPSQTQPPKSQVVSIGCQVESARRPYSPPSISPISQMTVPG